MDYRADVSSADDGVFLPLSKSFGLHSSKGILRAMGKIMRSYGCGIAIIVASLACASAKGGTGTDRDLQIYRAVLLAAEPNTRQIVVAAHSFGIDIDDNFRRGLKKKLGVTGAMCREFSRRNERSYPMPTSLADSSKKFVIIPEEERLALVALEAHARWAPFHRKYPGAYGIAYLMRPAVNKVGNLALIHLISGPLGGGSRGEFRVLRQENGVWKEVGQLDTVIE